ncbi:hypothetical protein BRCON_1048 [Candidatus Sumerlaea chitinivorans]|uniref:Uncharacterized protein n=1 Tax=Sumerlaea chitinivorans TaxID=2250252 RepID=A0A2Z4Y5X4_SUMC1|nr:hypothetical protein BRCON_1048 [Candidatus Sumerlaea chitinivorans]
MRARSEEIKRIAVSYRMDFGKGDIALSSAAMKRVLTNVMGKICVCGKTHDAHGAKEQRIRGE